MSEFLIKKASKQAKKLKMGISAPSGHGKTYGALLIAYGITGDWSKITVIDTERGSSNIYSELGEFNVLDLNAPYSPERFIECITLCEKSGTDVIVLDSSSHEWSGSGGCLDIQQQLGGKFTDWKTVTPRHNAFIDKVLRSTCHVICTTRKKQGYAIEGSKPIKLGLEDVQRDGFEYELDVMFNIENNKHLASISKDRTNLFTNTPEFLITEETGKLLKNWASKGRSEIDDALDLVRQSTTIEQLNGIYTNYLSLQTNSDFVSALRARRAIITESQTN